MGSLPSRTPPRRLSHPRLPPALRRLLVQAIPSPRRRRTAPRQPSWFLAAIRLSAGSDIQRDLRQHLLAQVATASEQAALPSIPPWLEAVERCLHGQAASLPQVESELRIAGVCCDKPWVNALGPWVGSAWATFTAAVAPLENGLVASDAWLGALDALRAHLHDIAAPALEHCFQDFCQSAAAKRSGMPTDVLRQRYGALVAERAWPSLLARWPVLARHLGTASHRWVSDASRVAADLSRDLPTVCRRFGEAMPPRVTHLCSGLSDPHDGGRTVWRVDLASGLSLYHKPRSLLPEKRLRAWLRWLQWGERPASRITIPAVLDAGDHGWMRAAAPPDGSAPARSFAQAGRWLALAWALGLGDIHAENLRLDGTAPVVVDAETLLAPAPWAGWTAPSGSPDEAPWLWTSPTASLMLPQWGVEAGQVVCTGALTVLEACTGRLVVDEVDALLEGYAHALERLLLARRRCGDKVLEPLRGLPTRAVVRPSQIYAEALGASQQPAALQCLERCEDVVRTVLGASRAITDAPSTGADLSDGPVFDGLVQHEVTALRDLDLPVLRGPNDSAEWHVWYSPPRTGLSGFAVAKARLDLIAHMGGGLFDPLLRSVLALRDTDASGLPRTRRSPPLVPAAAPTPSSGQRRRGASQRLLAEAARIGEALCSEVIETSSGPRWLAPHRVGSSAFSLDECGDALYDGRAGTALFLGALARHGVKRAGDVAKRVGHALVDGLSRFAMLASHGSRADGVIESWSGGTGWGLADGLAGVIWSLSCLADLLEVSSFRHAAREGSRLIPPPLALLTSHRKSMVQLDLMAGGAGIAVALLAAAGERDCDRTLLLRAAEWGEALCRERFPRDARGVAHGAIGVAWGLLALGERIGAAHLSVRGARLMARIRAQDAKPQQDPGRVWCASGLGEAALALPGAVRGTQPRGEPLRGGRRSVTDTLCCGESGRALLQGALVGRDAATRLLIRLIEGARGGGYRLPGAVANGLTHPGLYLGAAGIGWALLHTADASMLPPLPGWRRLEGKGAS